MKTVKLHNPSSLWIVNPKKGDKKMVRKRKTTATNRRRNPARRKVAVRSNRIVAKRVVRRNRRRNPQLKQLFVGGAYAALGAIAQGLISSFIPIKAAGVMGLAVQWGSAWITAMIGEKVLPGGSPYFAAGAAAGAAKSTFDFFIGNVGGFLSGQQAGSGAPVVGLPAAPEPQQLPPAGSMGDITYLPAEYDGVGDIVAQPEFWPGYN